MLIFSPASTRPPDFNLMERFDAFDCLCDLFTCFKAPALGLCCMVFVVLCGATQDGANRSDFARLFSMTISNQLLCTMFSKWLETAKDSANKLYSVGKSVLQDVTSSSLLS